MIKLLDATFLKQFSLFVLILAAAFFILVGIAYFNGSEDSEKQADGPATLTVVEPVGAVIYSETRGR